MKRSDFRPNEKRTSSKREYIPRKSNDGVIRAFAQHQPAKSGSMTSTGNKLYSYGTVIATRQSDGEIVLNKTKYSPTTSKQQTQLQRIIQSEGKQYAVTGGKERGYEGEDFSEEIKEEKQASKEYKELAKEHPEDEKKLKEISREESTHAKELKKLEGYNAEYEKMTNKQKLAEDKKHSLKIVEQKEPHDKIEKVLHEYKEGELKTASGKKVTSRKQAIAIALSEERAEERKKFLEMNKASADQERTSREKESTGALSLSQIKQQNQNAGQYFFSKDTMRMYRQVNARYRTRYDKKTDTNYVIVNMKKYPESTERKNVVYKYNKENGHLDIQN